MIYKNINPITLERFKSLKTLKDYDKAVNIIKSSEYFSKEQKSDLLNFINVKKYRDYISTKTKNLKFSEFKTLKDTIYNRTTLLRLFKKTHSIEEKLRYYRLSLKIVIKANRKLKKSKKKTTKKLKIIGKIYSKLSLTFKDIIIKQHNPEPFVFLDYFDQTLTTLNPQLIINEKNVLTSLIENNWKIIDFFVFNNDEINKFKEKYGDVEYWLECQKNIEQFLKKDG